jgi:MoaA/NifB/PqqE/SkfB family radical SAM enzyme
MLNTDKIIIELTSSCNLKCPSCPRTEFIEPGIDIPLDDLKKYCDFINESSIISLSGDHGDPPMHKKFFEAYEIICTHINPKKERIIDIETNGSNRPVKFWKEYLKIAEKNSQWQHTLTFSVDGFKNTNHIYRINAKWKIIEDTMKLMSSQNIVQIKWKYILFSHNIDDVATAYNLCKKFNFQFQLVDSYRDNKHMNTNITVENVSSMLN